jgi:hypothetical protein
MAQKMHLTMNQVTQGLHIALGALFVFVPVAKGWHHPRLTGVVVGVLFALLKEFVYDLDFETHQTSGGWKGSFTDFAFYLVGMGISLLLLI